LIKQHKKKNYKPKTRDCKNNKLNSLSLMKNSNTSLINASNSI
jgi:hypothetical protein